MRKIILAAALSLPLSANALDLTLGVGSCFDWGWNSWCRTGMPVGKIQLRQSFYEDKWVDIGASFDHYSEIGDGEWKMEGDPGINNFGLEIKIKLF